MSKSAIDQLHAASPSQLIDTWLPKVCTNFVLSDFQEVWNTWEVQADDAPTLKAEKQQDARWRGALKDQHTNLNNEQLTLIAWEAWHKPDYKVMIDCIRTLVKRDHNILNDWCQQGHSKLLGMVVVDALKMGKISTLKTVLKNLNADGKNLLSQWLLSDQSSLGWDHIHGDKEFEMVDQALNVLTPKIASIFEDLSKYPLDQLYDGMPQKHPWFPEWKREYTHVTETMKRKASNVFFDHHSYVNLVARVPSPSRPEVVLGSLLVFEALTVGRLSFVSTHSHRLTDDQALQAWEMRSTLLAHGINCQSIDEQALSERRAHAMRTLLEQSLPPQPPRPKILKKI